VSDQASEKRPDGRVHRKGSTPILAGGVRLSDEVVGVVQSHEHDDQTAEPIEGLYSTPEFGHPLSCHHGAGEVEGDDSTHRQL